ncbi:hypothetical protein ACFL6C_07220 [Myxococcota bacterium]
MIRQAPLYFLLGLALAACGAKAKITNPPSSCSDNAQNGDEIGVDCGASCPACQATRTRKIVPDPNGGVYIGDFPGTHDVFEQAIGRQVSVKGEPCTVSDDVIDGKEVQRLPAVDIACLQQELDQGRVVRLTMQSWFCRDTPAAFTVQDVIDGKIDSELRSVARALAQWGGPVFWHYMVEPVVQWPGHGPDGQDCRWRCDEVEGFPGGVCDDIPAADPPENFTQYGDPAKLDKIERYIDYHRRIHDVMEWEIEQLGLPSNITWVAGHGTGGPEGYSYGTYWVGDDYVDWHAYGTYAGATLDPSGAVVVGCQPFPEDLDAWNEVLSMGDKPVMLDEFGVMREFLGEPACTDRAAWFAGFFDDLVTKYPQIGMLYYMELDLYPWATVIQPDDPAAAAWQSELANRPERWPQCLAISDGSQVCR